MRNSLQVNVVLHSYRTNKTYRVLFIKLPNAVLCEMETTKLVIEPFIVSMLLQALENGEMEIVQEEEEVYPDKTMTADQKEAFEKRKYIVDTIEKEYGPDYIRLSNKQPKESIVLLEQKTGLCKSTIWKTIRTYLQAGRSLNAIKDGRLGRRKFGYGEYNYSKKTGRDYENNIEIGIKLDEAVLKKFEAAVKYYKSGRAKSLRAAYTWMNQKFYSDVVETEGGYSFMLLPASERPTEAQFYYYCRQNLSKKEKEIAKTSVMEYNNNSRLLLGDTVKGSHGPGDRIQMDEVEVDLFLQSSVLEGKTVGRPIVYCMIDSYSRVILALGIAFDNNSVIGMTNCFVNLMDDKVEYCKKYGIHISPEMWPSCVLPNRILCDRGSEYTSNEAERIFNALNIQRELVPAGSGSLKGTVEQWFHQMHSNQNHVVEKNGLMEKRYDSSHKKKAVLTLDEYTKMLLNFVIYHNNTPMDNYPLTKDMLRKGIRPVPAEIWKYGEAVYGSPRKVSNLSQYYYDLLLPVSGTVSRHGIIVKDLNYLSLNDEGMFEEMIEAGKKRIHKEFRMDPRDIGSVYYVRDKKLYRAELNTNRAGNADFAGLTLNEWETIRKHINTLKREGRITKQEHQAFLEYTQEQIINAARKADISVDSKDLQEARKQEKQIVQSKHSIYSRICTDMEKRFGIAMNCEPMEEDEIFVDEIDVYGDTSVQPILDTEEDNEDNNVNFGEDGEILDPSKFFM